MNNNSESSFHNLESSEKLDHLDDFNDEKGPLSQKFYISIICFRRFRRVYSKKKAQLTIIETSSRTAFSPPN